MVVTKYHVRWPLAGYFPVSVYGYWFISWEITCPVQVAVVWWCPWSKTTFVYICWVHTERPERLSNSVIYSCSFVPLQRAMQVRYDRPRKYRYIADLASALLSLWRQVTFQSLYVTCTVCMSMNHALKSLKPWQPSRANKSRWVSAATV